MVFPLTQILIATQPSLFDAAKELWRATRHEAPPLVNTEEGLALARPDQRLSTGVSFAGDKTVPAIFVEKEGSSAHGKADLLAESIPGEVRVIDTGFAHSSAPQASRPFNAREPLRPGQSVGHHSGWAGTIGCLTTKTTRSGNSRVGFVSAAHVLGLLNRAGANDPVVRPGYPDAESVSDNRIGTLGTYSYLVHHLDADDEDGAGAFMRPNQTDIASVQLDHGIAYDGANLVPDPSGSRRKRIHDVVAMEELIEYGSTTVYKIGRTTELTVGQMVAVVANRLIKLPDNRQYQYAQLIQIERSRRHPFSEPGDSGALVYTSDFRALGLVVGGNDKFSWAIPLASGLRAMSAQLLV